MPELGTQLRDYLDATAPPVELEEVFGLRVDAGYRRRADDRPGRRQLSRWAYAAVAAVIVLVVVGGVAWLAATLGGTDAPVVTQ